MTVAQCNLHDLVLLPRLYSTANHASVQRSLILLISVRTAWLTSGVKGLHVTLLLRFCPNIDQYYIIGVHTGSIQSSHPGPSDAFQFEKTRSIGGEHTTNASNPVID